jgi:hypothetical protein
MVVVRCYGNRSGVKPIGCGWVGEDTDCVIAPSGEEMCPVCGSSTVPPPMGVARYIYYIEPAKEDTDAQA